MGDQFKTLTIDFASTDDRNELFDKICELRCLNSEETKKKMKIVGNVPYAKIIELCNAQDIEMKLSVAVEVKPAIGAVVAKNPESIKETPVDSATPVNEKEPASNTFTSVKVDDPDDLF
jgi:hypothetical protein